MSIGETACSYAALILHEDGINITRMLLGVVGHQLLLLAAPVAAAGGGAAAAAPAAEEKKKEEPEEESDDDMGFGLFD
ncbi:60S acidic ribosomal protein P1-1 [Spatholobus suberectus]|nr:60S acidic ribosomal protein P1-1 [Spatholobus suberectus]